MEQLKRESKLRGKLTRSESIKKARFLIAVLVVLTTAMGLTLVLGIGTTVGTIALLGEFLLTSLVCYQAHKALQQSH